MLMKRLQFLIMVSLVMLLSITVTTGHADNTGPPGIYASQISNDFNFQVDPLMIQNDAELQIRKTEGRITIPGSDLTKFPNQGMAIMNIQNVICLLTGSEVIRYSELRLLVKDQWYSESYRPPVILV